MLQAGETLKEQAYINGAVGPVDDATTLPSPSACHLSLERLLAQVHNGGMFIPGGG